jgi:hypothetical protein
MSKDKIHIRKDLQNFLDYTGDRMSDRERNAFEKELQKDPFASEALEGMSFVNPPDLASDMADLQSQLKKRITIRRRVIIYRIAAAVAIFFIISASLLTVYYDKLGLFRGPVAITEPEKSEFASPAPEPSETNVQQQLLHEQQSKADKPEHQDMGKGITKTTRVAIPEQISDTEGKADRVIISPSPNEPCEEEADVTVEDLENVSGSNESAPAALKEMIYTRGNGALSDKIGAGMVTGVVLSSENKTPLAGAVISLKGSNVTAITDLEGKFEIKAGGTGQEILVVDFIGMIRQEVPCPDNKDINILMDPSNEASEDVLIKGFGSSIASVKSETARSFQTGDEASTGTYQPASPADGYRRYRNYISENINYPGSTELDKAVVVLGFVVNSSGKPEQYSVLMSPGAAFSNEAIRLLLHGPLWIPAQKNGKYLPEETRIRIVFNRKN